MRKIYLLSLLLILIGSALTFCFASQAATFSDINSNLEKSGTATGYDISSDYSVVVAQIIKTALSIVGGLFVLLIAYGGYLWMTAESAANKNNLDKAKKVITFAIIGLVIIVAAYAITSFVVSVAEKSSQPQSPPVTLLSSKS